MQYLILKGGLGNQLFELAAFLYLRKKKGLKKLKLDCRSGFFFDFKYRRSLEIKSLLKNDYSCSLFESINVTCLIFLMKYFPLLMNFLPVKLIKDDEIRDLKKLDSKYFKKIILFDGYFQNSFFVEKSRKYLRKIVNPLLNSNFSIIFESLYEEIKKTKNSVALCIRFYEESKSPLLHSNENGIKTIDDFNIVIRDIESKVKNPYFFIFVQEENNFTKNLYFRSPYKFVTHNAGYKGAWQRIKAQSYCKHHIFNNSTFYYWGAEFSNESISDYELDSFRYVSNNFIFKEIYKSSWIIF